MAACQVSKPDRAPLITRTNAATLLHTLSQSATLVQSESEHTESPV